MKATYKELTQTYQDTNQSITVESEIEKLEDFAIELFSIVYKLEERVKALEEGAKNERNV